MKTYLPLLLVSLLLFACEGPDPQGRLEDGVLPEGSGAGLPPSAGRLVIVGGALQGDNAAVYQEILDGREGEGPFCIFPTASADPEGSLESAASRFDAMGGSGTARGVFLTVENPEEARNPVISEEILACSGFFFVGGSQSRISQVFRPQGEDTPAMEALRERWEAGAVVSGSSAGAAIMTDPMIAGGNSVGALSAGVRAGEDGEGVLLTPGLGLLSQAFVDQHFLARGRWARLFVAILSTGGERLGFGIDENTALVVEGDSVRVVGASGVMVVDAGDASREEGGTGGYGVRLFLLGAGDGMNLETHEVRFTADKPLLADTGIPFGNPTADLFARWTLLQVLAEAAVSTDDRLTFHQDGHFLEFRKGAGFQVRGWEESGVEGTPRGLSFGPFITSVWREDAGL